MDLWHRGKILTVKTKPTNAINIKTFLSIVSINVFTLSTRTTSLKSDVQRNVRRRQYILHTSRGR